VLAKSPNCASHNTRELGLSMEYPSSNPSTPYSDRELQVHNNKGEMSR
jgi:hypothetical protein